MNLKIKGDLKSLSKRQLDVIEDAFIKHNIKGDISIDVLGEAGDNFASDVRVITINNEGEITKIIVKITQNISRLINEANEFVNGLFNNEKIMYTEVLPLMAQLQEEAGIPIEDRIEYATCYGASTEDRHEIILLEDLTKNNYVMLDKGISLSDETMKVVLNKLARYHSLSYAIKDKHPERFAQFCKTIINIQNLEQTRKHAESFKKLGSNFCHLFDNDLYKNIISETFDSMLDTCNELQVDEGSQYSVLIHGDCWINNFLFKMKDDQPTTCVMIDYQMTRKSMPVADILHLILNCTDYETRTKYYYHWLDFYHSELEKCLLALGLRIANIYPREKFDTDIKRYSGVSLCMGILTASLILRKNEEAAVAKDIIPESQDMKDFIEVFKVSTLENDTILKVKNQIEGLINNFIDFGYLNAKDYC